MAAGTEIGASSNYFAQLAVFVRLALAQLVRAPSHSRRAAAARHLARRTLWLAATGSGRHRRPDGRCWTPPRSA